MTATLSLASIAQAADPTDEGWPCQQRKVPTISAGQIWSGPPLEDVGTAWQREPEISQLARQVAPRGTRTDEAATLIHPFSATPPAPTNRPPTPPPAGVL